MELLKTLTLHRCLPWLCETLTHEMKCSICILHGDPVWYSEDNGLSFHLFQISVDYTHD